MYKHFVYTRDIMRGENLWAEILRLQTDQF